jgi:hypothetical protein
MIGERNFDGFFMSAGTAPSPGILNVPFGPEHGLCSRTTCAILRQAFAFRRFARSSKDD